MNRIVCLIYLSVMSSLPAAAQQEIPLYEGAVPNSKICRLEETAETGKDGKLRISNVTIPTLTVFAPPADKTNGTAVIICPGGGYGLLAFGHEGTDVAKRLNEWGITAFVLKYRLPNDSIMIDKSIGPLQDAQRAIQLVRENAKQWKLKTNRIGIMGFSAGGHLAATAGTHFTKALIDNPRQTSLRPDFMLLVYPVISFSKELMHAGSRRNLIGTMPADGQVKLYSNELQVTVKTPPSFLVHALDDKSVSSGNSAAFIKALQENGIAHGHFYYERGGHGFGMRNPTSNTEWMDKAKEWMEDNRLLK